MSCSSVQPHPDEAFVLQAARALTDPDDGMLIGHRILICDRDTKWSRAFCQTLTEAGIRLVQTPFHAPNCNAHAERFVRTIKEESASTGSCSSARPTSDERSRPSPPIITASGIIRVSTTD